MSETTPVRCPWHGIDDAVYARYHDEEWGVPHCDERRLFEKMVLESFQSGLSWLTILRKRDNFRRAFHDFDPKRIARYGENDFARLMDDAGIVRNRLKIEATIANAAAYLDLEREGGLARFLWRFQPDGPVTHVREKFSDIPAQTETSKQIAKALKARGFRFLGPTTVYAFMQSTGMVNDHLAGCHRHKPCAELQRNFRVPA
jgi:DNA-3-methyladenine glycosylase I